MDLENKEEISAEVTEETQTVAETTEEPKTEE